MNTFERLLKNLFNTCGLDVRRIPRNSTGVEPFMDMATLLKERKDVVVFDVGANVGQSIMAFKRILKGSQIHSFEPGGAAFKDLEKNAKKYTNVKVNNFALGGRKDKKNFIENTISEMSSFLELSDTGWGKTIGQKPVDMLTLDGYCQENNIPKIDILKMDTQGYEMEILKGSAEMLKNNRIYLVYMEIIVSDMYKDLPSLEDICRFMGENKFKIVSFYNMNIQNNALSWMDALFVNPQFKG